MRDTNEVNRAIFTERRSTVKSFSFFARAVRALFFVYASVFYSSIVKSYGSQACERHGTPLLRCELLSLAPFCIIGFFLLVSALCFISFRGKQSILLQHFLLNRLFPALMVLLFIQHTKVFLAQRIEISGESMETTFHNGQIVWIEKVTTGLMLPELSMPVRLTDRFSKIPKFGFGYPHRNDVVVFALSRRGCDFDTMIKRVIALPGDSYEFKDGSVFINGERKIEPHANGKTYLQMRGARPCGSDQTDGLPSEIALSMEFGLPPSGVVPDHGLLVLGDNRENSMDSRELGFIPVSFVVGRVWTLD